jgi:hypothetical protein
MSTGQMAAGSLGQPGFAETFSRQLRCDRELGLPIPKPGFVTAA